MFISRILLQQMVEPEVPELVWRDPGTIVSNEILEQALEILGNIYGVKCDTIYLRCIFSFLLFITQ